MIHYSSPFSNGVFTRFINAFTISSGTMASPRSSSPKITRYTRRVTRPWCCAWSGRCGLLGVEVVQAHHVRGVTVHGAGQDRPPHHLPARLAVVLGGSEKVHAPTGTKPVERHLEELGGPAAPPYSADRCRSARSRARRRLHAKHCLPGRSYGSFRAFKRSRVQSSVGMVIRRTDHVAPGAPMNGTHTPVGALMAIRSTFPIELPTTSTDFRSS